MPNAFSALRSFGSSGRILPKDESPLPLLWRVLWAMLLACAWLLPNHYQPWAAFHADAWSAMAMALVCAAVVVRSRAAVEWNRVVLLVAMLAVVPMLQFGAGLIPFAGQAWMSSSYLLGLLLAVLTGQAWERAKPDQCASALFLAIGLACMVSLFLQLQTWLGLNGTGLFDLWSMGLKGERAYANIGQPNQLGTLLLWGVLAAAWGYQNNRIGASVAFLLAAFFLLGVAMTMSRTAWAGLMFMLLAAWLWRGHWKSSGVPWAALALFACFWIYPVILRSISEWLIEGPQANYLRVQFQSETRHVALLFFAKAALASPWVGYGWKEIGVAQLAIAPDQPGLGMAYGFSHNLFMDLVLQLGIPAGIPVSLAIVAAFVAYVRSIRCANDLLLVMFLGVIGIHAMLEFPLYYAYFLLPVGLVVGVLNMRMGIRPIMRSSRWVMAGLWLIGVLLWTLIVRDYFRVEASFQALRHEQARIGDLPPGKPPEVLLLTQLRERIRFMRYDFRPGMSDGELQWATQVANAYPSATPAYLVARAMALNDRPQEARLWLIKTCKITDAEECDLIRRVWSQDSAGNPRIAAVPWPN